MRFALKMAAEFLLLTLVNLASINALENERPSINCIEFLKKMGVKVEHDGRVERLVISGLDGAEIHGNESHRIYFPVTSLPPSQIESARIEVTFHQSGIHTRTNLGNVEFAILANHPSIVIEPVKESEDHGPGGRSSVDIRLAVRPLSSFYGAYDLNIFQYVYRRLSVALKRGNILSVPLYDNENAVLILNELKRITAEWAKEPSRMEAIARETFGEKADKFFFEIVNDPQMKMALHEFSSGSFEFMFRDDGRIEVILMSDSSNLRSSGEDVDDRIVTLSRFDTIMRILSTYFKQPETNEAMSTLLTPSQVFTHLSDFDLERIRLKTGETRFFSDSEGTRTIGRSRIAISFVLLFKKR